MTTDSETMEQYLNFVWTTFLISVLVFVSRDYELGTKFRLIVVYLLRLTACHQVNVTCSDFRGVYHLSRAGLIFNDRFFITQL